MHALLIIGAVALAPTPTVKQTLEPKQSVTAAPASDRAPAQRGGEASPARTGSRSCPGNFMARSCTAGGVRVGRACGWCGAEYKASNKAGTFASG